MEPTHLLLIDIDGLRQDVFQKALQENRIPHLARLLGGADVARGALIPALAPAPSITFCSQACLFTGTHPKEHGIPGNQFFDRFGTHNDGRPRHYAFDVGDTLSADDAVRVFTDALASNCLQAPTLYQHLAERGWRSVVSGNMYATGADTWLTPSLIDIARFTKGGNLFGLSSQEYDRRILQATLDHLNRQGMPEVLTIHFLGLDHESHHHGPGAQFSYLVEHIDSMVGQLWETIESHIPDSSPLIAVFSDHGQIEVIPDDRHSLRLAFPFERELGHLFDALGLDVHDYPGEDPDCDAVVASNGGLAYVYLQNRQGRWADRPDFERDVLPVAQAFWEAHTSGKYAAEVQGALAGVLLRNVQQDGWQAPYQALTPKNEIVSLEDWFSPINQPTIPKTNHPENQLYVDPIHRLNNLSGPMSGDLLLISNYAEGFYFGAPITGIHGGLRPEDSHAVLAYGFPGVDEASAGLLNKTITTAIQTRCAAEGGRQPSTVDMMTGLMGVLN
jgi:hypothetical protein